MVSPPELRTPFAPPEKISMMAPTPAPIVLNSNQTITQIGFLGRKFGYKLKIGNWSKPIMPPLNSEMKYIP